MSGVAVVIPTRNSLAINLGLLTAVSNNPKVENIVIVCNEGASRAAMQGAPSVFFSSHVHLVGSSIRNAAYQRNLGIRFLQFQLAFFGDVICVDDDIHLGRFSLDQFIYDAQSLGADVLVGPCIVDKDIDKSRGRRNGGVMKTLKSILFLYPSKKGGVAPSGFHSPCAVAEYSGRYSGFIEVDWLPTGLLFISKTILEQSKYLFPVWRRGSYLEDLYFSYGLKKKHGVRVYLALEHRCSTAYPEKSSFGFGIEEVVNRYYFVRSNSELSLIDFFFASCLRTILSLFMCIRLKDRRFLLRALGNVLAPIYLIVDEKSNS